MTIFPPMTFADILSATPPLRGRRLLAVLLPLIVATALAIVGAFGTYVTMTLPLRLLHFVSVGLVIGALAFALSESLRRICFGGELPFWARLAIAFVTAPPGAWIVQQALSVWAPQALPYVSYPELTAQVLSLNLAIGAIAWLLLRRPGQPTSASEARPADAPCGQTLRARLPVHFRHAAILALSAEDHYVRVRTDRGETLILMNLAVAIAALGENAGVRIHRSHWISLPLAEAALPRGSRHGVCVDNNTVLPVSRAGRKLLHDI
jgi:LytTr DNA-binding domain